MPFGFVARVLGMALALGVLGDWLVRSEPLGLNFFVGIVALVAAAAVLLRRERPTVPVLVPLLLLLPPFFAFGLAFRDAPMLIAWNVLAVAVTLALPVMRLGGVRLALGRATDYGRGIAMTGFRTAIGPLYFALSDVPWSEAFNRLQGRRLAAASVGSLLAIPLLAVFGALLASADAGFESFVRAVFDVDFETLISHVLGIGFITWISAGYLLAAVVGGRESVGPWRPKDRPGLGGLELGIPLGALTALFSVFVAMQAEYVFGGHDLIVQVADLGYAEYARRGFFELVAVAVLVVPVLLVANWLADITRPAARRTVWSLSAALLLLVALIMGSALHRMSLYVDAYGLTQSRVYALAVLGWTAGALACFAATVLRGRSERFSFTALVAALVVLGTLNVINPDAIVVRTNVARAREGAELDAAYLASLSADAVPALVAVQAGLEDQPACTILDALVPQEGSGPEPDWRSWNLSRARARTESRAVAEIHATRCGPGE